LRQADLTILLHSTNGDTTVYLEPIIPLLQARRGMALSFVGKRGEPAGLADRHQAGGFSRGSSRISSPPNCRWKAGQYLWGDLVRKRVLAVPHALNPDAFSRAWPTTQRQLDIGVRAVQYLPHLGDDERNRLHEFFLRHAFEPPLKVRGVERAARPPGLGRLSQRHPRHGLDRGRRLGTWSETTIRWRRSAAGPPRLTARGADWSSQRLTSAALRRAALRGPGP